MAKKINITAQLNAATTDGILADAGQIFDAKKGKFQEQVNEEFEDALEEAITSEETDKVVKGIEEGIIHNALRKTEQILTEAEKGQARENIGAVSEQTFENEAVRVKKQVFTSEQKYQARHNISAITAEEAEKIAQDKIYETSVSSPDKLQAVKELSSWLESNPDSAATMNAAIQDNAADIQRLYRGTGIDEYSQFSTGMDYAAGAVVLYDGVLFRFKTAHAKGEWDYNEVEEWSEKKEREEKIGELGSEVSGIIPKVGGITTETITHDDQNIDIETDEGENIVHINKDGVDVKNAKIRGVNVMTEENERAILEQIEKKQDLIPQIKQESDVEPSTKKTEAIDVYNDEGENIIHIDQYSANFTNLKSNGEFVITPIQTLTNKEYSIKLEEGYYTDDGVVDVWDNKYRFQFTVETCSIVTIPSFLDGVGARVYDIEGNLITAFTGYKAGLELTVEKGFTVKVNVKSSEKYSEVIYSHVSFIYTDESLKPKNSDYRAELYLDENNQDNKQNLQNLIDIVHVNGGGCIVLPQCNYKFKNSVKWRSNVSMRGKGQGTSLLTMLNGERPYTLFTGDSIQYANFSDFSVDAYDMEVPIEEYTASNGKAFYMTNLEDCTFKNLCLLGTPATSLGIDFLNRVEILSVSVIEGGRCWNEQSANPHGGSGIGIGMGKHYEENFVISNCICVGCGNNGIFIEDQHLFSQEYSPMTGGYNQIVSNNIVRDGRHNGIAARGCRRTKFTNNISVNNANAGFSCDWFLDTMTLSDNIIEGNKYGVFLKFCGETSDVYIVNNKILKNTEYGIYISTAENVNHPFGVPSTTEFKVSNIVVSGNNLYENNCAIDVSCDITHFVLTNNDERSSVQVGVLLNGNITDGVLKNNSFFSTVENNMNFTGNNSFIE